MPDAVAIRDLVLEVLSPDGSRQSVPVAESPFRIGRGRDSGNNFALDDALISRQCAEIVAAAGGYDLVDRGNRHGVFVNGSRIDRHRLGDGDVITFGVENSYQMTLRMRAEEEPIQSLLTRIETLSIAAPASDGLGKLNLLLEATSLLHSHLPLESVLASMIDHAVTITGADRGLLLEADDEEDLHIRLARSKGAELDSKDLAPSQTAIGQALEKRAGIVSENLTAANLQLQSAQSVVAQRLRSVVAIPLYALERGGATQPLLLKPGQLLGVLYLDSRSPAAFSKLDRRILDALSTQATSILDNARLLERERERERLEQELGIARKIQQALAPAGNREFPSFAVSGIQTPCLEVGGDYFDVLPMEDGRVAILIADVSGKGVGAALLATILQGILSGITIGAEPVRVFNHINRFLCEHPELGRYATMFLGILQPDGVLDFFNAGHVPPLLVHEGEVTELFSNGSFPLGLVPEASYAARRTQLQPDDTLVLFSDGVTEACDPVQQMYGDERLREVVSRHYPEPLDRLQSAILQSVEAFTRGSSQADDITLLLVRRRAAAIDTDA